jgi:hypothetical protein
VPPSPVAVAPEAADAQFVAISILIVSLPPPRKVSRKRTNP